MVASPIWTIWCDGELFYEGELRPCPAWCGQTDTAPDARRYALGGGWKRRKVNGKWMDLCRDCEKLPKYGGKGE